MEKRAEAADATDMRKKFILAGLLSMYMFHVNASQYKDSHIQKDTLTRKTVLKKTDIELVYSHYAQNGSNSAVTGGIGTEKLTVYAPGFNLKQSRGKRILSIKAGSDIISSASTDKIDFARSSASMLDARTYANLQITQLFPNKKISLSAGSGFSIESDYFSLPLSAAIIKTSKDKMRTFGADLQVFLDDLRWGRLNPGYYSPQYLIYPEELRYQDWFKTKKRQSYNLKLSFTGVINKRNIIGVFPEFSFQYGLLSTPFHRVYFKDSAVAVERLPGSRVKFGLGLKLNSFCGSRLILRNSMSLYTDDFGILSLALENETAIKLSDKLSLTPFFRIYSQRGSMYFAPYRVHEKNEEFYTSDYDLSDLYTIKPGLGLRFQPLKNIGKHFYWQEFNLRYSYYSRSNGLYAHMLTMVIAFSHQKKVNL